MSGGGGDCTMTGVDCLECNSLFEETSHQKFSVPLCHLPGAGANKTDEITVKPISFIHDLSLAPLSGRVSMMVQDPELVTSLEWRELPSSSKQSLLHQVFSDTVGSCSGVVYSMSPCLHVFGRTFQPRGAGAGYEGLCCTKSELRTLTRVLVSLVVGAQVRL